MKDTLGWRVGEPKDVHDYGKFKVQELEATSPRTKEKIKFKIIDRPRSVLIVPFTRDGRVILVKQFRPGVRAASLELPAGLLNEGESPLDGAKRELEEETGYRAARMEILREVFHDPAILTSCVTFIIAHDCVPSGEKDQDEGEDVHTLLHTPAEVDQLVADGSIMHSIVIALWLLARPSV